MRSYYSFVDQKGFHACSIASDEYPLIVNCAGNMETSFPFTTDNPTGREDYYLLYMVKGRMTVSLPAGERIAEPGCVLLFPPRYPYHYAFGAEEHLSYFWVHFTGSYAARLLEECGLRDLPLCFDALAHQCAFSEAPLARGDDGYPSIVAVCSGGGIFSIHQPSLYDAMPDDPGDIAE